MAELGKRASGLTTGPRPAGAADHDAYPRKVDGLIFGHNPAQGVFDGQKFLHPDLDLFIQFPPEWKIVNSPTAVGAHAVQGDAMIVLSSEGPGTDPLTPAASLVAEMNQGFGLNPTRSEALQVGSWPARLVAFQEQTGKDSATLYFLWVAVKDQIYRMTGLSSDLRKDHLRRTAESFRHLTAEEKASIKVSRVRVVEAREGEDLQSFCWRTFNVLKPEGAAVMNGLETNATLQAGQWMKIVAEESYLGL